LAVERPRSCALSELFWRGEEQCAQLVGSLCVRLERRTPRNVQGAHHLRDTVGALGLASGGVRLECPGGGLGVGGVVLAKPAPVLTVRAIHLEDLYTSGAQEAGQPHAEAAAALAAGTG
jgi:hypothetical protein